MIVTVSISYLINNNQMFLLIQEDTWNELILVVKATDQGVEKKSTNVNVIVSKSDDIRLPPIWQQISNLTDPSTIQKISIKDLRLSIDENIPQETILDYIFYANSTVSKRINYEVLSGRRLVENSGQHFKQAVLVDGDILKLQVCCLDYEETPMYNFRMQASVSIVF